MTFWTNKLAIGMNDPEIGKWLVGSTKEIEVRKPADTVIFADAQAVTNPTEPDPDQWIPANDTLGGREWVCIILRCPTTGDYNSLPQRPINRQNNRCIIGFVDGHVEVSKASKMGFQYPKGHSLTMWDKE